MTFIKTFDALALGEKNINIVDIDASADGTKLYVLDSTKGFTYVDITDLLNHVVPLTNILYLEVEHIRHSDSQSNSIRPLLEYFHVHCDIDIQPRLCRGGVR